MHITIQLNDGEIMVPHNEITLQKELIRNSPSSATEYANRSFPLNQIIDESSSSSDHSSTSSEDDDEENTSTEEETQIARDERGRFASMGTRRVPDPAPRHIPPTRLETLTARIRRNLLASSGEDNASEAAEIRRRTLEDMDEAADILTEDISTENRNPTDPAEYEEETMRRLEREIVQTRNPAGEIPLGPFRRPAGEVPLGPMGYVSPGALRNYARMMGMPEAYVQGIDPANMTPIYPSEATQREVLLNGFATPEIPVEPPTPTFTYYARTPRRSLHISQGEYERVQGILRQLNAQEIVDMEDKFKIEEVKKSWAGKNPLLFGIDLSS